MGLSLRLRSVVRSRILGENAVGVGAEAVTAVNIGGSGGGAGE